MDEPALPNGQAVESFFRALVAELPDLRDPRGKRLDLSFVITGVIASQLCGAVNVSSIHRFITHRLPWLQEVTGMLGARGPSRSHLPRLLSKLNMSNLQALSDRYFGSDPKGWAAGDGKTLRGASREGERQAVVLLVDHETGSEIARMPQIGDKESEIPVLRELLRESGLEAGKLTLDAGHCNSTTLSQIASAGGQFIVQVKGNQPELTDRCCHLVQVEPPIAQLKTVEKGHGRLSEVMARLYPLRLGAQDERWHDAHLRYVIAVTREIEQIKSGTISRETSFYVTNVSSEGRSRADLLSELNRAVRRHWSVESNNWVRDMTLGEDALRTKNGPLAQILALLRGVALAVLRRVGGNLRAVVEQFCHEPDDLALWLRRTKVL